MSEQLGNIEVCTDCALMHANGEIEGAPDREPLSLIEAGYSVTLDSSDDEPFFSWFPCEGCGSRLGGDRFTMMLWKD